MSKLSKAFNEFFYPWGDNEPKQEVWRYGKNVTLEQLHGYDDYAYYRPRRQMAGTLIILGGLASGYYLLKGGSYLKTKYDARKTDKENL